MGPQSLATWTAMLVDQIHIPSSLAIRNIQMNITDDVNRDVDRKSLTMHLLIYHPLHVKCLQYDNATSKKQYERKSLNCDSKSQSTLRSFLINN